MKKTIIREEKLKDCKQLQIFINTNDPKKLVLPRSYSQLVVMLPNYFVAEHDGEIVGCCGFKIYPDESVEIISLVVAEFFRRNGLGPKLVSRCVEKATKLGFKKFFVLTMDPDIFKKLEFHEVSKKDLPMKIWNDCINCTKNIGDPGSAECPETALKKIL